MAMRNLFTGLILLVLAIVLLSLPDQIEGPVLIPISPGHALSVLDAVALIPLLCGTVFLQLFLWHRRDALVAQFKRNVPIGILITSAGGFGLGLLVASAFSLFFWWWAIGAGLLLVVLFIVLRIMIK